MENETNAVTQPCFDTTISLKFSEEFDDDV